MNKKLMFVFFAVLMMAVMTVSVSADQLANDRWCNSDQYGCWVTGDDGAQNYIMFWSEAARDLFMGPGSNAVVTDPYPAGKMPLDPAPAESPTKAKLSPEQIQQLIVAIADHYWKDYADEITEELGSYEDYLVYIRGYSDDYIVNWYNQAVSPNNEESNNAETETNASDPEVTNEAEPSDFTYKKTDKDGNVIFETTSAQEYVDYINSQNLYDENGNPIRMIVDENGYAVRDNQNTNSIEPQQTPEGTEELSVEDMTDWLLDYYQNNDPENYEGFTAWLNSESYDPQKVVNTYNYMNGKQ